MIKLAGEPRLLSDGRPKVHNILANNASGLLGGPRKIVDSLSDAGLLVSTLYLMILAVSIIDFCLSFTGLPNFISLDVLGWMRSLNLGGDGSAGLQLRAHFVTILIAILLGMGIPTVPAYINVALLMGPVLVGLGIATFTAHMFIFYFAVASAITPPVALAAFAAASIIKAEPMATGFSAVKSGIVMFVIPFIFALYPEILLIDAAVIDPAASTNGSVAYLIGYDGQIHWPQLAAVLLRIVFALYLIASALAGFDRCALKPWEIAGRLCSAVLILSLDQTLQLSGFIRAGGLLVFHRVGANKAKTA